ncbi:MAG: hypothetical protein AB7P03_19620 [Kofleriaceae bacterium]
MHALFRFSLLATVLGCGGYHHDQNDQVDASTASDTNPPVQGTTRKLDVLFVVDDSSGMLSKQQKLAAGIWELFERLEAFNGDGLPDLHVGVISSDVGTRGTDGISAGSIGTPGMGGCIGSGKAGILQTTGAPVLGTFITDTREPDGSRRTNYTGELADVVGQMVMLGEGGCGFEQPLQAMRLALDGNVENAGFLRSDAALAVVFITDEDDCSIAHASLLGSDPALGPLQSFRCTRFGVTCDDGGETPDEMNELGAKSGCRSNANSPFLVDVGTYVGFLKSLKSDPSLIVVAGLFGDTSPVHVEARVPTGSSSSIPALAHSCSVMGSQGVEVADPGIRLKTLFDGFPGHQAVHSICRGDFGDALYEIANLITVVAPD